jgi:tRNA1(Val) A37 N6-methylase TrmN6
MIPVRRLPDLDFEKGASGMPPGHDALALARAVNLTPGMRILDLGTGQGVIALMLAARERVCVTGVERELGVMAIARRNGVRNASLLRGSVRWVVADVRALPWVRAEFDLVVMNPPYYRPREGRLSPNPARAAARHEVHGALGDWVRAAAMSLRPGGQAVCVHLPRRCAEIVGLLETAGFEDIVVNPAETLDQGSPAWSIIQARLAMAIHT